MFLLKFQRPIQNGYFLMGGYIGFLIHSLIQKIFRHCHKDGIMFWWHFGVNTYTYIVEIRFGIINLLKLIKYDNLLNEIKSSYFFSH